MCGPIARVTGPSVQSSPSVAGAGLRTRRLRCRRLHSQHAADLPTPEPAAGEVLVEVEAASVNGFDLSVAAGYVWDMIPGIEFPVVLGRDLVSTITALGDGVDSISVGDRVAAVIPGMALGPRTGSLAEYVALPATAVAAVPAGVEAQQAAVIGLAGIAAHDALDALSVQAGETVVVSGATGGVGSIATQLAAPPARPSSAPPGPDRRRSTSAASARHTPLTTPATSPPPS